MRVSTGGFLAPGPFHHVQDEPIRAAATKAATKKTCGKISRRAMARSARESPEPAGRARSFHPWASNSLTSASLGAVMSNQMWGGRFTSGPAAIMEEINASIDFDIASAPTGYRRSKAHVAMLAGRVSCPRGRRRHRQGSRRDRGRNRGGTLYFSRALEDIHMNVEPARRTDRRRRRGGCTPRARATTRSRPISGSGCATRSTGSTPAGRPAERAGRTGREARRHAHAGLHPSADRRSR